MDAPTEDKVAVSELPAESKRTIWTRRLIILSFWAVVVFLGLPHWTWTTSIRRSPLPLEAMNSWDDGNACQLQYPLHIQLQAPEIPLNSRKTLASIVETILNGEPLLPLHTFYVSLDNSSKADTALTVNLDFSTGSTSLGLRPWEPVFDVKLPAPGNPTELGAFVAQEVSRLFMDESAALSHMITGTPFAKIVQPLALGPEQQQSLEKRTTRAFKYASTYHLTFSLFTPTASPSAWEIDEALRAFIDPLLKPLSSISKITIDTQVQLYASFSPSIAGPVYDDAKKQWKLKYDDLTGFVNAAEWPLSPSIGSGPTINFVLYMPSPEQTPLTIGEQGLTSWIIPQWGGVQIHNAAGSKADGLTVDDLKPDMLTFADQLTSLLGVPKSPPSLPLRISSLARERATSLILSASSTLGALSRLTLKLTSIAIPDSVADAVDETLLRLDKACTDLRKGRFQSALENARTAEEEVEKAFFEPSMVGQVYFPEEHKVAVYVPLLGPMAVPLIMSALKELRKLRERKRKTA